MTAKCRRREGEFGGRKSPERGVESDRSLPALFSSAGKSSPDRPEKWREK